MVCKFIILFLVPLKLLLLITLYPATDLLILFIEFKVALDHKQIKARFNLLGIYRVEIAFTKTKVVDARKMIVDGAVGMVEMALERLNENDIVQLDEERKAAMVSNLLVVLCGNHDAQPVVNSGSLY